MKYLIDTANNLPKHPSAKDLDTWSNRQLTQYINHNKRCIKALHRIQIIAKSLLYDGRLNMEGSAYSTTVDSNENYHPEHSTTTFTE